MNFINKDPLGRERVDHIDGQTVGEKGFSKAKLLPAEGGTKQAKIRLHVRVWFSEFRISEDVVVWSWASEELGK